MANPKRRKSKAQKRQRRAANRWHAPQLAKCPQCDSAKQGHTACPTCGYYGERQVLTIEA